MSFKDLIHSKKQEKHSYQADREPKSQGLSTEQLHELAMEMSCGYGMLPPCGFPDGIWHLY